MAKEQTVISSLYKDVNKLFSKFKDKIATDCESRPFGQKNKCKAMYRVAAYTKAIPIVKRKMSQCKKDIWIGEDKCRKKLVKVMKSYQAKIDTHKRAYTQWSSITPTRKAQMNNLQIDPITQMILEKDNINE